MFDNATITPVHKDKPHIVFVDRYWRVSKLPRPYSKSHRINNNVRQNFDKAHAFARYLNKELHCCVGE